MTREFLAAGVALLAATAAQATTLSFNGTADDSFKAYLSTDTTIDGLDTLITSGTAWSASYLGSVGLSGSSPLYLLVEAKNGPAYPAGNPGMFVAKLSLDDSLWKFANGGTSLTTNTTDWSVSAINGGPWAAPTVVGSGSYHPGPYDGKWVTGTGPDWTPASFIWQGTTADDQTSYFHTQLNPVPEPSTYALVLAGLGVIGFVVRRRRPQ